MSMRILVIHEFKITSVIVRNHILSEHGEEKKVEIVTSPREAKESLERESFDVVICGLEMAGADGLSIHGFMRTTEANKQTPFIIMTSSYNDVQLKRLAGKGIKHVLPIPFTSVQLNKVRADVYDQRQNRVYTRYSIPDARFIAAFGKDELKGDLVNMSLKGLLVELAYPEKSMDIMQPATVTVQLPEDYEYVKIQNLEACTVRLTVESWRNDFTPDRLKVAFKIYSMPEDSAEALGNALEKAYRKLMFMEGEVPR